MLPGSESMGAPLSFSSRRPNASHLPQFELPPPQLPGYSKHSQSYPHGSYSSANQLPTSLTSVGNLLTPPSGVSGENLSPISSAGVTTSNTVSGQQMPSYTPNGYSWPQLNTASAYGFQSSMAPSAFAPSKSSFSSVSSMAKGNNSPTASELAPPPYCNDMQSYATSMPMSAPVNLPALASQQSIGSGVGHTQPSPHQSQGSFSRPPPTPTYSSYGSHASSTPAQTPYPYSAGPSPIQHSPVNGGGHLSHMSPASSHGPMPSLHSQPAYGAQRPYGYPLPGPVMSNMNSPNHQLALVGGMGGGMMPSYNSGHVAQMQHMYGHPAPPSSATNDRPFKCDQCPQSFNRNHDLKRHKRIHLAVKPFPCGHCDKSFSRKDALKRHILVKGCGKARASGDADRASDGSISPGNKSEMTDSSPVIAASA